MSFGGGLCGEHSGYSHWGEIAREAYGVDFEGSDSGLVGSFRRAAGLAVLSGG